ncbi:MAG: hypothetical protein Q7U47_11800 [Paludibacter sp.]|nr:hypothetical protein [Paludibacter sp.]
MKKQIFIVLTNNTPITNRREQGKTSENHKKMVENGVGKPSPDGSPDPKRNLDNSKVATIVAFGLGVAAEVHDNIPKPEPIEQILTPPLAPLPVQQIVIPEPTKILPANY